MADEKDDPIGEEFYAPLLRADRAADILFLLSAALSFGTLLINRDRQPFAYDTLQIAFALSVIALFCTTLAIRLYLFPRAQVERFRDFLSHALKKPLSHKITAAYYNNSATTTAARTAAQVLESSFFTKRILAKMAVSERIKVGGYALTWLILIFYRGTDLAWIGVAAQVLFSEQILSHWLRLEWFRSETEKIYSDVYRLFNNKAELKTAPSEFTVRYEIVKATSAVSLSTKIFQNNREMLNSEWNDIRKALGI